jgi:hypothetical protein
MGVLEIESHKLFALGWVQTVILLTSASQVARLIGMSHWHPAKSDSYITTIDSG